MKTPIYLVEKSTGLRDANNVDLWYAVAARLTRKAAEQEFATEIKAGTVRVRKLTATK